MKNTWSSRLSFIIAAIGAAVGLGSIWMFPYMAGSNGGSAFVLVYLIATIFIGIPMLSAEIVIGRLGRSNVFDTIKNLASTNNASSLWQALGILSTCTLLIVLGFYSVLAGWSLEYLLKITTGKLIANNIIDSKIIWHDFYSNYNLQLIWHSIFMFLTISTVASGIKKGIEKVSNIMMPGLFIIIIILLLYGIMHGDFSAAVHFLFYPDFSKLSAPIVMQAIGQACFNLAVGAGCMLVYGCYLPKNSAIISSSVIIALAVLFISLLAGLAIFPLVFAYGLEVDAAAGLMFQVLPVAFTSMPYGELFGAMFFLLLFFAALTSSISLAEPIVLLIIEKCPKIFRTRRRAAIIVGLIAWCIGSITILVPNAFEIFTNAATNILLPLGGIAFTVFATRVLSVKIVQTALPIKNPTIFMIWKFLTGTIAPIAIFTSICSKYFF